MKIVPLNNLWTILERAVLLWEFFSNGNKTGQLCKNEIVVLSNLCVDDAVIHMFMICGTLVALCLFA